MIYKQDANTIATYCKISRILPMNSQISLVMILHWWKLGYTYVDNPYDSILSGIILEEGEFIRYLQLEVGAP